jgi:hypothetical protein
MMKLYSRLFIIISFFFTGISAMERTPAPDNAEVYIISPMDNESVNNPVQVIFGLKNMGIAPAGVKNSHTGHHHLLIDLDKLPALDRPIPNDKNHIHFGKGQTESSLNLTSGKHTLQLILGDHHHIPHDPAVISNKITIFVN